jgi:hypothetical protein
MNTASASSWDLKRGSPATAMQLLFGRVLDDGLAQAGRDPEGGALRTWPEMSRTPHASSSYSLATQQRSASPDCCPRFGYPSVYPVKVNDASRQVLLRLLAYSASPKLIWLIPPAPSHQTTHRGTVGRLPQMFAAQPATCIKPYLPVTTPAMTSSRATRPVQSVRLRRVSFMPQRCAAAWAMANPKPLPPAVLPGTR